MYGAIPKGKKITGIITWLEIFTGRIISTYLIDGGEIGRLSVPNQNM